VNPSQIRKDLAYFGEFGVARGVGYYVQDLIGSIKKAWAWTASGAPAWWASATWAVRS
jgi:NADH/NAD ratio-sensing transcriptional regulator Rex